MVGSSQQVERTVRRQPRGGEAKRDVFISHSSADRATATEIHDALVSDGQKVWFDDTEIQIGVLLSRELQEALRACRVLILSWSEAAAASRWVNFEWIAAHHLHRFILPIMLDGAHLPQCFEQTVRINLALDREAALRGLSKAVRAAKAGANPLPPPIRSASPELTHAAPRGTAEARGGGQRLVHSGGFDHPQIHPGALAISSASIRAPSAAPQRSGWGHQLCQPVPCPSSWERMINSLSLSCSTATTVTPSQSLEPVQPEDDAPRNGRR